MSMTWGADFFQPKTWWPAIRLTTQWPMRLLIPTVSIRCPRSSLVLKITPLLKATYSYQDASTKTLLLQLVNDALTLIKQVDCGIFNALDVLREWGHSSTSHPLKGLHAHQHITYLIASTFAWPYPTHPMLIPNTIVKPSYILIPIVVHYTHQATPLNPSLPILAWPCMATLYPFHARHMHVYTHPTNTATLEIVRVRKWNLVTK